MKAMKMSVKEKQTGVVLLLSLIILSVLTLIAVTGMKTTINQEKMSGNFRDNELAHQAAESALQDAATFLDGITNIKQLTNTNGLLESGTDRSKNEPDFFNDNTWSNTSNFTMASNLGDGGTGNISLATAPRYVIKHIGFIDICKGEGASLYEAGAQPFTDCEYEIFRVTAHGTGISNNTSKILQMYYAINKL